MDITFYKYHGTGNDFIIVDNRDDHFDSRNVKLVNFLCDRRFGIGADGLMLLENNPAEDIDFTMRYYNSDGKEASMCGNGGRCISAFAVKQNVVRDKNKFYFNAVDGLHEAGYANGIVNLKMIDIDTITKGDSYYFLNTGSPHYISHQQNINDIDIIDFGRKIRYSDTFKPEGTNVNIVEEIASDHIKVKTYERGVEDETFSCGTGAVASAIATYMKNKECMEFNIDIKGGRLNVSFDTKDDKTFSNIWLTGAATFVFKGTIDVEI